MKFKFEGVPSAANFAATSARSLPTIPEYLCTIEPERRRGGGGGRYLRCGKRGCQNGRVSDLKGGGLCCTLNSTATVQKSAQNPTDRPETSPR